MVIGLSVSVLLMLGLIAIVWFAARDKRLYIVTEFDLRVLPHGAAFSFSNGQTRRFSIVDARIAYATYVTMDNDKRRWFTSMSDFIRYAATVNPTLLATLSARTVDPAEYELDRSGWDDEDDKR